MALPLQGSATYNAPPVFNDPDFQDLQPHEQAQVLGSLYPTFNTLSPQDQAGILTGIQNTYNPQQNSLAGFFNALNTTSNQAPQYTNQSSISTQSITPSSSNPQNPVGGLQQIPVQTPANHPLVSFLNQTAPKNGSNLAQSMQKGTLLANAGQTAQGGSFTNLPNLQNTLQQPASNPNLKAQVQMLGQKYNQLNQMANNSTLDAQTRQNAKNAGRQLQNIYRQLNQQNARAVNRNLPQLQQPSTMQTTQQASPWQQLKAGNVLHDDDMRRLFQSIQAKGNSAAEQRQANLLRLYAVQKLAENTLANANRAQNGDVLIQGVPVRAQDALYFAKQDMQHFLDAQTHLNPNQLLAAGMANPQTPVVIQQTVQQETAKKSPYLSPKEAYNKIQNGKYSEIKNQKISQYYTWGDVMVSNSITSNNIKSIPLELYKNAEELSKALDNVSRLVGAKVPLQSWIRVQSKSSNHKFGMAVDFQGTKEYLHGPVYNAVRRTPEIKGIGQSEPNWLTPGLHIDNGRGHMPPTGQQEWFNDNPGGVPFKNPKALKLEPATSTRILRYKQ